MQEDTSGATCRKCGETKDAEAFAPSELRKLGRGVYGICRACNHAYQMAYRAQKADELRAKRYAQYWADPEKARAERRARRRANPERAKRWDRTSAEWRKRDRVLRPEKYAAAARRYYASLDAHGKWINSHRTLVHRQAAPRVPFDADGLALRWAFFGGVCWICCDAPAVEWDHVKPLVAGGWHCLSNLRPACRSCNARKNDTWPWPR